MPPPKNIFLCRKTCVHPDLTESCEEPVRIVLNMVLDDNPFTKIQNIIYYKLIYITNYTITLLRKSKKSKTIIYLWNITKTKIQNIYYKFIYIINYTIKLLSKSKTKYKKTIYFLNITKTYKIIIIFF